MEQESKECRSTDSNEYGLVSIPLQVGQEWRTYGGETITLTDYDPESKTFQAENKMKARRIYTYDGSCNTIWMSDTLKELVNPGPQFEAGQVWLRSNGAEVTLFTRPYGREIGLCAYFVDEEDPENKLSASVKWNQPDQQLNLVKLLKPAPAKPPLGLRPRFIALEERIREINEAIDRYKQAEMTIPSEWLDEKNFILYDLERLAFNRWWDSEGSAMAPKENENQQEYVRRVSHVAWDNGIFMGRHHEAT